MMLLPWYVNGSTHSIIVWDNFNHPEKIKELMPGELHLFLHVLENGWRQIKFWDLNTSKWHLGWLSPGISSFPMWFFLYKKGMFTEKARLFNERGNLIGERKTLFYFRIKSKLNVFDKNCNKLCSYPTGTLVAQDGYFHSLGQQADISHCYTGRDKSDFTYYPETRYLDPMFDGLNKIITQED